MLVIAEETTPKVYKELFENQHNFAVMTNHLLSFNKRMRIDKNIPMGEHCYAEIDFERCEKEYAETFCVGIVSPWA